MSYIIKGPGQIKAGVILTPPSTLMEGLYGAWNADGNANDSFGSYDGTPQGGLTYTTGKISQAFSLNGSNSYVSINDPMAFKITTSFTISVWVKMTSFVNSPRLLHNFPFEAGGGQRGWQFYLDNGQPVFFYVRNLGGPNGENSLFGMGGTISLNTWTHLVLCLNQTTGSFQFYKDGVLQRDSFTPTGGVLYPQNSAINYAHIGSSTYSGLLDAPTIWGRILTQSEVTELYKNGNGKQYPF